MSFSFAQIVVWTIIGLISGSLVGLVVMGERKGFGLLANLALGLAGALVGGILFRMLGLFPGLEQVTISLRDIVSAVIGSALVLIGLWIYRSRNTGL
ncbi:MAG TPA: GlsB/YeaQ/YmgE family stress response membrane protein [Hyphomicrobium sp.]|nr:GlsB/YeaQ/YmgE family stress response membrane protein [Hyphomicrobium sp.]